jgi:hypothetical protein
MGTTITDNFGLLFPVMAIYFVGALFLGVRWMTRPGAPAGGVVDRSVAPGPKAGEGRHDCCNPWIESDGGRRRAAAGRRCEMEVVIPGLSLGPLAKRRPP